MVTGSVTTVTNHQCNVDRQTISVPPLCVAGVCRMHCRAAVETPPAVLLYFLTRPISCAMLDRVTRLAKHCIQYCAAMQGPLLANYSQSFIEQLRNASLPYANSSVGLKQRLHFEDNSRLQRFLVWLKLAVKRISWGAAAAHHKRKDLVTFLLITLSC